MASTQYGGWASTPNAAGVQPVDAFSRLMLMRYGGRTDNLFDYQDETGYKREMGPAGLSGGGSSSRFQGSGMAETNFGGGNTSSNPGGYNWATLQRNLDRGTDAFKNMVNYRMQSSRLAKAKTLSENEQKLQAVYGYGQDPLTTAYNTAGQKVAASQKANQVQSIQKFAANVVPPSQNLTASMQAKTTTLVPGASKPIKGRKSQGVNLIYPNGNPPAKKQGSRKPGKPAPYSGPQPPAPPQP